MQYPAVLVKNITCISVLDHGYVENVDHWGSDESIIEAARMSVSGGFVSWKAYPGHPNGDTNLLSHLYAHKHMSPFEMAGLVIEVKAPIFVFREWHRHRTQSYNEASARYTPLPNDNYVPTVEDVLARAGPNSNKQASSARIPSENDVIDWLAALENAYSVAETVYQQGLTIGIPKELARLPMPVGRYSKMRASANLRNWMQFLELREHPTAQKEIRLYAESVHVLLCARFPRTMKLFEDRNNGSK